MKRARIARGCQEMKTQEALQNSMFFSQPCFVAVQAADSREVPSPNPRTGSLDRGSCSCDSYTSGCVTA